MDVAQVEKPSTVTTTFTTMLSARVPRPLVARLQTVVKQAGHYTQTDFIVDALAAAVDRHERELSGAGTEQTPDFVLR